MNEQAEAFRKITMRVLTMQLNSITIMDLIAYGGAAAGMILAVSRWHRVASGWRAVCSSCCWRRISFCPCGCWAAFSMWP